ncbi:MAG: ABC transporter ATP-binding protein [Acidimicrobiales bacterium]|nr:ABC transporter ATP-binding protein [Acidimicrobiales bacterium]
MTAVSPPAETALDVSVENLSAAYGANQVLHSLSLSVAAGETIALLGPSGCGKTTLLRCIAGLERPTAGQVTIGQKVVASPTVWVAPERRGIGMVFQNGALFPHLDVESNIAFGLARNKARSGRVSEMLDLVGLGGLGARMPSELSGGQQQRVALARALAPSPRLLLLDEPFSSLDVALRVMLRTEVRSVLSDVGVTALFVTHDQDEAFVMGDRVAVLRDGNLEQIGTPSELYATPANPWVAGFVGEANLIQASAADADGTLVDTALGRLRVVGAPAGPLTVLARPEQLALRPISPSGEATSGGVVTAIEYYGHSTRYSVKLADTTLITVRAEGEPDFAIADRVIVETKATVHPAWSSQREARAAL